MPFDAPPYYHEYTTNKNLDNQADNENIYYFAYGSNMDDEQMDRRRVNGVPYLQLLGVWPETWGQEIGPAIPLGRAILKNYQLNFDKKSGNPQYCYASLYQNLNALVEGVLYFLDKKLIKVLDFCEGVHCNQYTRELVEVSIGNEVFLALVYIAHPDFLTKGGIPCKSYLQTILRGAEKFSLSDEYLTWLKMW